MAELFASLFGQQVVSAPAVADPATVATAPPAEDDPATVVAAAPPAEDIVIAVDREPIDVSESAVIVAAPATEEVVLASPKTIVQEAWSVPVAKADALNLHVIPEADALSEATSRSRSSKASSRDRREIKVALMRGPVGTGNYHDENGTGLVIDANGTVTSVLEGGMAARWGQIKRGDCLLSIGGREFEEGTDLREYLVDGKDSYLCEVSRKAKSGKLSDRLFSGAEEGRFETEADCAAALERAGDYHKGLVRGR